MSGWRTKKANALAKREASFIKSRERLSTPRAEFLLKFAFMSDEQFEKWSELKTSAESRAFMEALPMPQIKTNEVFIKLDKEERQGKSKMKKCINGTCENTQLVYSGVDAFLLGIETEKWCYTCANAIALSNRKEESNVA